MSSFLMHIAISEKIKERFNFSNNFILGAVLPDLNKILINNRDKTHYIDDNDTSELPNLNRFIANNINKKDEITYGYLCHLVQDKILFEQYINDKYKCKEDFIEIYNDYSQIDKYIREKNKIDINSVKQELRKICCNNSELIKVIEESIKEYAIIPNRKIKYFTNNDADEYFELALNECNKILEMFINRKYNFEIGGESVELIY